MPGCTRLSGACGGSLARACVFSVPTEISLQREQSTRTHAVYRASTSATPLCSTPPPPQQALDNRRSTWLAAHSRRLGGRRPRCAEQSSVTTNWRRASTLWVCASHDVGVDVADPAAARSRVPMRGTVLHTAALLCDPLSHPTIRGGRKEPRGRPVCRRKPNSPPTRVALMGRGWPPTRVAGVWEISEFSHGTRRVWSAGPLERGRARDRLTV
mmetsp:Transcript_22792/g.67917  ORF Transcript_22792/g.67917 Transcript_22792/m.67917 type:complete len:213 (+) Transcript_22792:528-1166(+)